MMLLWKHFKFHQVIREQMSNYGERMIKKKIEFFEELSAGCAAPVNPPFFFSLSLMLIFAGCKFAQLRCKRETGSGICDGKWRKPFQFLHI